MFKISIVNVQRKSTCQLHMYSHQRSQQCQQHMRNSNTVCCLKR